jgi:hypothetical protein
MITGHSQLRANLEQGMTGTGNHRTTHLRHMKIPQLHQLKIVDNQQQMVIDIHYLNTRHLKIADIHYLSQYHSIPVQMSLPLPLDLMLDMGFQSNHCLNIRHQLKMVIDNYLNTRHLKIADNQQPMATDTRCLSTSQYHSIPDHIHQLVENRQAGLPLPLDLMLDLGLAVRNIQQQEKRTQQQGIVDQRRQFVQTNMR